MIPLDDPTLETSKQEQEDHMCQKSDNDTPCGIPRLNMNNYIEGQQRTGRILM
jgi:hypothetical protein